MTTPVFKLFVLPSLNEVAFSQIPPAAPPYNKWKINNTYTWEGKKAMKNVQHWPSCGHLKHLDNKSEQNSSFYFRIPLHVLISSKRSYCNSIINMLWYIYFVRNPINGCWCERIYGFIKVISHIDGLVLLQPWAPQNLHALKCTVT